MFSPDDLLFVLPDALTDDRVTGACEPGGLLIVSAQTDNTAHLRDFLEKILQSVGKSLMQGTAYAESPEGASVRILPFIRQKRAARVIVFGFQPEQVGLGIRAELYRPVAFYGTTFLFADRLDILEPDRARKTQLWQALKQLFPGV